MSPFRGVYTIKCTAGWITPSSGAWLQWGTCVEAEVMLFEQLAQFSSACSNVHRSEAVVPHRGKNTGLPELSVAGETLLYIQCHHTDGETVELAR